jgi:hypothetical protein
MREIALVEGEKKNDGHGERKRVMVREKASIEGREKGNDGQGERKRALVKGREHMHLNALQGRKLQH